MAGEEASSLVVEVIPRLALPQAVPLTLPASQIVIRLTDGTPVALAACFGPDGAYAVSKIGDADFERLLDLLGIKVSSVQVDWVKLSTPPAGAIRIR